MKYFLVCILLFLIKSQRIIPEPEYVKYEAKLEIDSSDDLEGNKIKDREKMLNLVNIYIKEKKWDEEEQIDKETFTIMFIHIIQKSPLKQRNTNILNRFAEKTINKYGVPIIVKKLHNYFNLDVLEKIYLQLFNPKINTDL